MSTVIVSAALALFVILPYIVQRMWESQTQNERDELAFQREVRHTQMGNETFDPYR